MVTPSSHHQPNSNIQTHHFEAGTARSANELLRTFISNDLEYSRLDPRLRGDDSGVVKPGGLIPDRTILAGGPGLLDPSMGLVPSGPTSLRGVVQNRIVHG